MDRGSKKDLGNALLKKLQSSQENEDIGKVWAKQTVIKNTEALFKYKEKSERKVKLTKKKLALKQKLTKKPSLSKKKWAVLGALLLVVIFANTRGGSDNSSPNQTDQTAVLGDQTGSSIQLPKETPDFAIYYPGGVNEIDLEVVRISPEGSAPSYTYVFKPEGVDGPVLNVSQQEVPDNFDLASTAKDFQATDIIQIDDNLIHYGYSEKTRVQSLLFIKGKILVSISSSKKLTDDTWASFYLGLKN